MSFTLNVNPIRKCKHCGKAEHHHKGDTKNCPFGSAKFTRCWPTSFYPEQFFEPKPIVDTRKRRK